MLQILIIRLTALSNHCVPGTSLLDSTDPRNMFSHWFFTSHLSACRLDITKIPKRRVPRINESLHQAPVSIYAGMCLLRFSSVPACPVGACALVCLSLSESYFFVRSLLSYITARLTVSELVQFWLHYACEFVCLWICRLCFSVITLQHYTRMECCRLICQLNNNEVIVSLLSGTCHRWR